MAQVLGRFPCFWHIAVPSVCTASLCISDTTSARSCGPVKPSFPSPGSCSSTGMRGRGAGFRRGSRWPAPTRGDGIKEGVAVKGAEAPLLSVPAVKVRVPVLEVSENLSWELDGRALGGLSWHGTRADESREGAEKQLFPKHRAGTPKTPCPNVWFLCHSI